MILNLFSKTKNISIYIIINTVYDEYPRSPNASKSIARIMSLPSDFLLAIDFDALLGYSSYTGSNCILKYYGLRLV